jgi:hypothetical protein
VSKERAADLAGRCCSELAHLVLDPESELLAHQRGWIWTVYYTLGKARTHFALIHSDGTSLARALADEVVAADRESGGQLHTLIRDQMAYQLLRRIAEALFRLPSADH